MAWTSALVNGRKVSTEAVTLSNGSTTNSSTIDFISNAQDFTVISNVDSVNTTGANTTEVQASFDGVTWVTATSTFCTDFDAAAQVDVYVAATSGNAPYYRLQTTSTGDNSGDTVTFKVIAAPYTAT